MTNLHLDHVAQQRLGIILVPYLCELLAASLRNRLKCEKVSSSRLAHCVAHNLPQARDCAKHGRLYQRDREDDCYNLARSLCRVCPAGPWSVQYQLHSRREGPVSVYLPGRRQHVADQHQRLLLLLPVSAIQSRQTMFFPVFGGSAQLRTLCV